MQENGDAGFEKRYPTIQLYEHITHSVLCYKRFFCNTLHLPPYIEHAESRNLTPGVITSL